MEDVALEACCLCLLRSLPKVVAELGKYNEKSPGTKGSALAVHSIHRMLKNMALQRSWLLLFDCFIYLCIYFLRFIFIWVASHQSVVHVASQSPAELRAMIIPVCSLTCGKVVRQQAGSLPGTAAGQAKYTEGMHLGCPRPGALLLPPHTAVPCGLEKLLNCMPLEK